MTFISRLLLSLIVKEFWKSVNICQSYGQLSTGLFFNETRRKCILVTFCMACLIDRLTDITQVSWYCLGVADWAEIQEVDTCVAVSRGDFGNLVLCRFTTGKDCCSIWVLWYCYLGDGKLREGIWPVKIFNLAGWCRTEIHVFSSYWNEAHPCLTASIPGQLR